MLFEVLDVTGATNPALWRVRRSRIVGAVAHSTNGNSSAYWLQQGSLKEGKPASAHALIERDGTIILLCRHEWVAYHAGVATLEHFGLLFPDINEVTLGVEIECLDNFKQQVTTAQHIALALWLRNAMERHGFTTAEVWGHYQIAKPMGRRSDPHGLRWGELYSLIYNPTAEMLAFEKGHK